MLPLLPVEVPWAGFLSEWQFTVKTVHPQGTGITVQETRLRGVR